MPRIILLAVILSALSLSIFLLLKSDGKETVNIDISPGSFMEDVRIVNRDTGALQWSLMTKKALISEDGGSANMQNVRLTIHPQNMTVVALSGLYNIDNNDLFLSGDVEAETDKYTIKTDRVNVRNEMLSTDSKVMIEGQGFRIEGTGLNASGKKIKLQNDVTAIFN